MAERDPFDSPSLDEPAGQLVQARSDAAASLGERIAHWFHKLTWRSPVHAFRLRGRYPLKLLATPDDPLEGNATRGEAMLAGTLRWRGHELTTGSIDFRSAASPQLADYLHRFEWLRDLAACPDRAAAAKTAEALTRRWLEAHGERVSEPAWRPDNWGWRILFMTAHAPLILASKDLIYRSSVLNSLARGARHLDRTAQRAGESLPRLAAWSGLLAAGLLIPGGEPRRAYAEAGLAKALTSEVSADGGLVCRTPARQAEAVTLLAMLREVYRAVDLDPPHWLGQSILEIASALAGTMLGDGGLSSWQGGPPLGAGDLAAVLRAAAVPARPPRASREWGYQRAAAGRAVLVCDAAPPPVSRIAVNGCASTLAFEMSDGNERLIVNCGGGNAGSAALRPVLAAALRSTAAHSTLTLADSNSTAILSDGTLGKGVSEVRLDREEAELGTRIEASHDGYLKRFGLIHRRSLVLEASGGELRGEDVLLPGDRRARGGNTVPFAIRFHLGQGVEATPTADRHGALVRSALGTVWQFRCRGGAVDVDASLWIDAEGLLVETQQVVVTGQSAPGGASIDWTWRRAA